MNTTRRLRSGLPDELPTHLHLAVVSGGREQSSTSPRPANRFEGEYSGTYTAPSLDDRGLVTMTISPAGSVSGTVRTETFTLEEAELSGRITNGGAFMATAKYHSLPAMTLSGTLAEGADGRIGGTLTQTNSGGATSTVHFVLSRV